MRCPLCGTRFEPGASPFCPNSRCGFPVEFMSDVSSEDLVTPISGVPSARGEPSAGSAPASGPPPVLEQSSGLTQFGAWITPPDVAGPDSLPGPSRLAGAWLFIAGAAIVLAALGAFVLFKGGYLDGWPGESGIGVRLVDRSVISVAAASFRVSEGSSFAAENTLDGQSLTGWQPAGPSAIGASLTYTFVPAVALARIEIENGAQGPAASAGIGRIKDMVVDVDGRTFAVTIEDTAARQVIAWDFGRVSRLTLQVLSVYPETEAVPAASQSNIFVREVTFFERFESSVPSASDFVFPVAGKHQFIDTWGAPRSGGRTHQGTDVMAPYGTPLVACVAGRVTRAGSDSLGGTIISVQGTDGTNYYYAHMSAIAPGMVEGSTVRPGELLGFVGDSGNAKGTTPHLHFGIKKDGRWINPYPTLMQGRLVLVDVTQPTAPPPQATTLVGSSSSESLPPTVLTTGRPATTTGTSPQQAIVPNLVGLSLSEAEALATEHGVPVEVAQLVRSEPSGYVLEQDLTPGSAVALGTPIRIWLSTNTSMMTVVPRGDLLVPGLLGGE